MYNIENNHKHRNYCICSSFSYISNFIVVFFVSEKQEGVVMEQIQKTQVLQSIKEATMVLVGIGKEVSLTHHSREELLAFYNQLEMLLHGKFYFVVTLNTDDLIYESKFDSRLIVAPCGSDKAGNVVTNPDYDESVYLPQWKSYQQWLGNTLNQKFVILELGVGMEYPTVLRFPDEKMAYFNQKSLLCRIHRNLYQIPAEIRERGIGIQADPVAYFAQ